MPPYTISDIDDLKQRVRNKTLYEDSPQELTSDELESNIHDAMLRLDNQADVTEHFADTGVQQATLYASCIEAKCAIENYSVDSWDVGAGNISVAGAGDPDQKQFQKWASDVADGLSASDHAESTAPTNIVDNAPIF